MAQRASISIILLQTCLEAVVAETRTIRVHPNVLTVTTCTHHPSRVVTSFTQRLLVILAHVILEVARLCSGHKVAILLTQERCRHVLQMTVSDQDSYIYKKYYELYHCTSGTKYFFFEPWEARTGLDLFLAQMTAVTTRRPKFLSCAWHKTGDSWCTPSRQQLVFEDCFRQAGAHHVQPLGHPNDNCLAPR